MVNFSLIGLAVLFNVVSVCFAATMTCYSDSSCTKMANVCHWVSNPLNLPIGKCVDVVDAGSMKVGLEIEKCSGTYVEDTIYQSGCGTQSTQKMDGDYVGKCLGGNGIYYMAEC